MAQNVVGSNFPDFASEQLKPSKKGYGQNQYGGASSDLPGEHTTSGFLPEPGTPINSQMRTISDAPIAPAFGMKRQTKPVKSNAGA